MADKANNSSDLPLIKTSKASTSKLATNKLLSGICATCNLNNIGKMVCCDACDEWNHFACVGVDDSIKDKPWVCKSCQHKILLQKQQTSEYQRSIDAGPSNEQHGLNQKQTIAVDLTEVSSKSVKSKAKLSSSSSHHSSKTTSSIRSAKLKQLEDERKERERREEEEIQLREQQIKMHEKLEKEKLALQAQKILMRQRREEQFLAEKKRIIEDGAISNAEIKSQNSQLMKTITNRTCRWVDNSVPGNIENDVHNINNFVRDLANNANDNFVADIEGAAVPLAMNLPNVQNNVIQNNRINDHKLNANEIAARHVLPKDLPNFNGNPLDWAFFISAFETTTNQCGFSNTENMMRLQRCLKGNALMAVKSCLLRPEKVPEVIETLKMLYGKPELIILTLIDQMRTEPAPKADNLSSLIHYALTIRNLCATIEASGLVEHLNNPTLLSELVSKLPTQTRLEWGKFKRNRGGPVDMRVLSEWMYDLAQSASEVTIVLPVTFDSKLERKSKTHLQASHSTNYTQSNEHCTSNICIMDDQQSHSLKECSKFKGLSTSKRWDVVTKFQLCRTCLVSHIGTRCKKPERCGVDDCKKWHNSLLHKSKPSEKKESSPSTDAVNAHHKQQDAYLFKIVPVLLRNNDAEVSTFAFLDDGSSITLMEESVAEQLGLAGPTSNLCLKWTADKSRIEEDSMIVSTNISGTGNESRLFSISNIRTVKNLCLPIQSVDAYTLACKFRHFKGVPIQSYEGAKPSILIGLDHAKLLSALEVREGGWFEPILSRTRLGWCAYGPTGNEVDRQSHKSFHICDCNDESLHELVKQQFSIDNLGIKVSNLDSKENTRALKILNKTMRKVGSNYEIGLLWKYDNIEMPNSYPMAKRRLECLEKKMSNDPDFDEQLRNQISYYISQGYARKLNPEELSRTPRTWYLPLFTTKNPNKPHKFRMVWDAAAKVNGICLNTVLLKGPDLLTPLLSVLYQFREREIGICADLKEMFHQVSIISSDQSSQRFLWRESNNDKPDEYVMQVMTFGAACSPCAAQFIKNKNAEQFEHEYPRAVNAILGKHYVDDYLDSMDTVEDAIQIAKDVQNIHKAGGFELRNWHSNSRAVLEALHASSDNNLVDMNVSDLSETEKVLGMWWRLQDDMFTFSINYARIDKAVIDGSRHPTKREMLRTLMTIYDPLGLLSSFLIYLKILMQDVWRAKVEWDQKVSDQHFQRWIKWVRALHTLPNIEIPRCYGLNRNTASLQLHTFVDASSEAYAAVCYFRMENQDGVQCSMIRAKTKVAPLNPISIPRMELQAALLGSRLAADVEKGHSFKIARRIFWSDSRTVLCWLQGDPKQYRQFVSFRVGEILESTNICEWRWIDTKSNVADEATKWPNHFEINSTCRWFRGPQFLYQPETNWPEKNYSAEIETVDLKIHVNEDTKYQVPKVTLDVEKYSDWYQLLRVQCFFQRWAFYFKKRHLSEQWSQPKQLLKAEVQLFKLAQWEVFKDEILTLSKANGNTVYKTSTIYNFSPFLDNEGLLRVKGRIELLADVQIDQKWPIILPRTHKITLLLVDSYHKQFNHINHETVVNEIRQRFAIPKIRVVLKSVRKHCQVCKNLSAAPRIPEMSCLPQARLSPFMRPFTFVGLDFFGPIEVAVGRRSEKRWGALFTCMSVRAVHIEVAHSLSLDSCIMVVRNFMARRGQPHEILCDRGTNFVGASNELKRELENLPKDAIIEAFSKVKWSFNPPASPHMGGAWERLVRSVKNNLMFVMPKRKPTDELLRASLIEIEHTINSRPLTNVPVDPHEPEAITPNHIILGSSSGVKPSGVFSDDVLILRKNWKISQQVAQHFWTRWLREYVPIITRRSKWFTKAKPIEVDDIVLIADEKSARNSWPLGRVISTQPSKDGQTRSATIQTSTGVYIRPASKIAVLDVRDDTIDSGKPSFTAGVPGGDVTN